MSLIGELFNLKNNSSLRKTIMVCIKSAEIYHLTSRFQTMSFMEVYHTWIHQ